MEAGWTAQRGHRASTYQSSPSLSWGPDLEAFIGREGHTRVPQRHTEGGFHLGNWVSSRRMEFKKGKLLGERIADLAAIKGWVWEA